MQGPGIILAVLLAVPHLKMIPGIYDDNSGKYVAATLVVDATGTPGKIADCAFGVGSFH